MKALAPVLTLLAALLLVPLAALRAASRVPLIDVTDLYHPHHLEYAFRTWVAFWQGSGISGVGESSPPLKTQKCILTKSPWPF